MDKQQAQFILHSFRPDGADAADADFAEALQMAVEDRELGEWLADERATDSAFASALCELEIPDELRMHILAVMHGEKPNDPAMEAEMDAALSDALSHVEPPAGLRDQILAAMHMQEKQDHSSLVAQTETPELPVANIEPMPEAQEPLTHQGAPHQRTRRQWWRIAPLAAAVAFGVFLALQIDLGKPSTGSQANTATDARKLSSYDVQREAAQMLLSTQLSLDVTNPQIHHVNNWLTDHQLPAPQRLPSGLKGMKVAGCKKIQIAGSMPASLVCFVKNSGHKVHLVVINNDHINDAHLPGMDEIRKGDCKHCPKTGWNMTCWRDRENTYLLFAKKETTSKDEIIRYF
ncbi:hypothetical protein HW115_06810 [Verrucomicrobiaceae bacterium N1E253]|uniref:Uncharacterized protein n=1 Tax=Oceaniferula marina TaxID=2748318 RepID=A0A851GMG8_9BACT|nr:hypothetical protein [Oceaniferula marina]NWK55314.1 hypothetical protein [Oceaniferula marina]